MTTLANFGISHHSTVAVLLLAICATTEAATPPPSWPFSDREWPATLMTKPSTGMSLGAFRVEFEKTTLEEVRLAANSGTVAFQGHDGENISYLCYTIFSPSRSERVWIISDGEMGGSEQSITSVAAQRQKNYEPTPDCPALPKTLQPVSLDSKIWLGVTGSHLKKLGSPSHRVGAWSTYDFQGTTTGECEGGKFDVLNWLMIQLDNGIVNSLFAGQVTSC